MKMRIAVPIRSLLLITLSCVSGFAQAVSVSIPGTANPYLAGMPDGSTAPPDQAPYQSPVEVTGLNLSTGGILTFTGATGGVSNTPTCDGTNCSSIDGNVYNGLLFYDHEAGSQNGMSDIRAPINSLVGVFLTIALPTCYLHPQSWIFKQLGSILRCCHQTSSRFSLLGMAGHQVASLRNFPFPPLRPDSSSARWMAANGRTIAVQLWSTSLKLYQSPKPTQCFLLVWV